MQAQADKFKSLFGDISDSEDSSSDSEGAMDVSNANANTNNATTSNTTNTINTTTTTTANTTPSAPLTAAQLARERALKAMQSNASAFAAMMGSDSDSEDESETGGNGGTGGYSVDVNSATKSSGKVSSGGNVVSIGNTSNVDGTTTDKDTNIDSNTAANSTTTTATAKTANPHSNLHTPVPTADETPVCIICQADANAEGTNGNVRTLGYLALLQASTTLCHPCVDSSSMHVSPLLGTIHSKIAPKQLSSECNTHISFCGHGKCLALFCCCYVAKNDMSTLVNYRILCECECNELTVKGRAQCSHFIKSLILYLSACIPKTGKERWSG